MNQEEFTNIRDSAMEESDNYSKESLIFEIVTCLENMEEQGDTYHAKALGYSYALDNRLSE